MSTMANFNVLLRWKKMVAMAQRALPIDPDDTRKLFREFQLVGRQVVFGTLVTAVIQGTLGGLVCWVTGVPKPLFFGATTAFLSPIPVVGSLAVWAGVGIFRIATGHLAAGVAELVLGVLLVGVLVDDVIRPRLVGGGKKFPALFTFIGLIGGIPIFGPSGLIVGPILVALSVAILKIYSDDSEPVPR
jgi:predicted PurR-regulated permease PerM